MGLLCWAGPGHVGLADPTCRLAPHWPDELDTTALADGFKGLMGSLTSNVAVLSDVSCIGEPLCAIPEGSMLLVSISSSVMLEIVAAVFNCTHSLFRPYVVFLHILYALHE